MEASFYMVAEVGSLSKMKKTRGEEKWTIVIKCNVSKWRCTTQKGEAIDLFGSRTVPPWCWANQCSGPEFQKKSCWTWSRTYSSASDVAEVHHARCWSWEGGINMHENPQVEEV